MIHAGAVAQDGIVDVEPRRLATLAQRERTPYPEQIAKCAFAAAGGRLRTFGDKHVRQID